MLHGLSPEIQRFLQVMALDRGDLAALDATWYHGWCKECYRIKPAVEKVRRGVFGSTWRKDACPTPCKQGRCCMIWLCHGLRLTQ